MEFKLNNIKESYYVYILLNLSSDTLLLEAFAWFLYRAI